MSLVPAPNTATLWRGKRARDAAHIKALEEILLRNPKDGSLYCIKVHTPESCKQMYKSAGAFVDVVKTGLNAEIEEHVYESFVEGDFDENDAVRACPDPDVHPMFCVSLHSVQPSGDSDPRPLGVAYWRELPEGDVKKWMKASGLKSIRGIIPEAPAVVAASTVASAASAAVSSFPAAVPALTNGTGSSVPSGGSVVPTESSLSKRKRSYDSSAGAIVPFDTSAASHSSALEPAESALAELSKRWTRLELIAVPPAQQGKGLSSLLMVAVLTGGLLHARDRCTLCVAGGDENAAARHLYRKFGFVDISPELLHSPNRNVMMHANTRDAFTAAQVWDMVVLPGQRKQALDEKRDAIEHKP